LNRRLNQKSMKTLEA